MPKTPAYIVGWNDVQYGLATYPPDSPEPIRQWGERIRAICEKQLADGIPRHNRSRVRGTIDCVSRFLTTGFVPDRK